MTGRLLHELVAAAASEHTEKVAVVLGDERLTYAQLEQRSHRVAGLLLESGCARGDRVAIMAAKSTAAVVAMLATLEVGAAYVPVDVDSPPARIGRILASADPAVVLATRASSHLVVGLRRTGVLPPGVTVGLLDGTDDDRAAAGAAFGPGDDAGLSVSARSAGRPDDPAHILFTSGSTGVPKGVVITHANVTAFLRWATRHFGLDSSDRISGHPPLHFDLSTFDIYGALSVGAELHLVPPGMLLPRQLAEFITSSRLTQWFSVPSTFTYMARLNAVPDDGFPLLRRVLWCGEVLPTPVLAHWMRRIPQATFTNLYGPTETTIASSFYTVPAVPADETAAIPIGTACDGEELLVLDAELRPAPSGVVGDLWIGGSGLSPGYWRDDDRTNRAFVPDPRPGHAGERIYDTGDLAQLGEDELLRFHGRRDSQIKSRGYRIELGEVEAALAAVPGLTESAVVGVPSQGFEGTAICCAYVPSRETTMSSAQLRSALTSTLPGYMLPSRWLALEALPKNLNGKTDYSRLRELFAHGPERTAPPDVNHTERRVERVFHDALGVEVSSPTLDVIEEGLLDSLGLVTLLVELEREFSISIPLDLEIDSLRTIESLAAFVERVAKESKSA